MTLLGSVILASAVSAGYYGTRYISNRKATRSSAPPKTTEAPAIKRILSASATQDAASSLVTDKTGYVAGETVNITGSGYTQGESVTIQVKHADGTAEPGNGHESFSANANPDGTFAATWPVNNSDGTGNDFVVTATGNSSGSAASSAFQRIATVETDKYDYQPGETAIISGAGFRPGEVVTIRVEHSNGRNDGEGHRPHDVVADGDGRVRLEWYVHPDDSLGSIFRLWAVGADSHLTTTSTFTDVIITVIDDNGPDDQPGQKDLSKMSSDLGATAIAITWNWDDTDFGNLGGNTGDACSLIDTDSDGNANYAFCVVADGNPAGQISNRLYSCNDSRVDRCAGPTLISPFTSTSTASVVPGSDPFAANPAHSSGNDCDADANCLTADTVANVTLQLSDVGGASVARLTNVCSYPSQEPNSDPSDCVVNPDNGFLTIVKVANPDDGTAFTFNLGAGQASQNGTTSWTINGSGTTGQISFPKGTSYDLSEVVPAGWDLTSASCAVQTNPTTPTGSFSGSTISDITVQSGLETICTFNDGAFSVTRGKIITVKQTNPDGDSQVFDFAASWDGGTNPDFSLSDGQSNDSGFLVPGTYSVSETVPSGWTKTSATCVGDDDGSSPASIQLDAGETVTCTFTNTKDATLKLVKKVTNDNGGTALATAWTLKADNTVFTTGVSQVVAAATYTLSESGGPSGYSASAWSCSGFTNGGSQNGDDVTVNAGENVTCEITNDDQPGKLTVIKHVINDNGGTAVAADFTLDSGGTNDSPDDFAGAEAPGTEVTLDAGSYNVTESGPSGYTASYSADCSGTIGVGESKTCTVTNDDQPGKLTVIKHVINDNGGTAVAADFTLDSGGANDSPDNFAGAESPGTEVTLDAGAYNVTESGPSGYTASYSADCSGSIANGQTKTCTVTNDDQPGKLTIIKHVINDNGGTASASDFTLDSGGTNDTPDDFAGAESPGTMVTLDAGSYNVTESGPSGYTASYSAYCSGTIANGQTKTCTVTNNDQPAKLIVIKHVINDNGGTATAANYTLDSGGANDTPDNFAGAEAPGTEVTLDAGAYNVTESGPTGYTASYSADCSGSIANGQTKTCTVTNDDKAAKLIVIKHVINDNGGTATAANFTLDSGGTNDTPDDFAGAESPGTEITLDAGSYNVTETGPSGYSASYSAYCSGTIANGQTKTCTVTNNDQAAKLIVIKHVINDNGGTATAANFTLDSGGTNDTPDDFAGAESPGTMVTLDAGSYNVTESGPAGYSASFSAYCSGSIANGQTKTCTVTNNDISPTLRVIKDIVPDTDGGLFNLRIDGMTAGTGANVSDGGTTGFVPVNAGNHTVSETAGTSTTLSDYVSVIGGDCAASGSVSLALAQNKTCTITNTKKGMAQIVKTVNGLTPPSGQTFTFEIRDGASTTSDGTTLETKTTDASGNLSFTTKLEAGKTYQICEQVFPAWNTNLAGDGPLFVPSSIIPPSLPNPNVNNLTVCADFTVQPGQTRTFTVDNTPPPGGRALTIGFWKNWASCSKSSGGQKNMLDLALGYASKNTTTPPGGLVVSAQNPGSGWPNYAAAWYLILKGNPASTENNILPAADCTKAVNLLNKSSIDGKKKMASDPLFNMTAQLVAAELNRFIGAGISGTTIVNIDRAVLLNGKYKFDGLGYAPKLTAADTALANCLATQLDNYNNNRPVSSCP
jgi:uncharacterized cupredoxin-like copper-binding protein